MFCLHSFSALLRRCQRARFGGRNVWTTWAVRTTKSTHGPPARTLPYEVDSNVAKNTELYRYDNFRVFGALRIFSVSQVFLWTYLAHASKTLFDDPNLVSKVRSDGEKRTFAQTIAEKLTVDKYRYGLVAFCLLFGEFESVRATCRERTTRMNLPFPGGYGTKMHEHAVERFSPHCFILGILAILCFTPGDVGYFEKWRISYGTV